MDIYTELPKEIRLKIYYYALPKMSERLKRAINITSSHQCFQRIYKIWTPSVHGSISCIIFCLSNMR